MKKIKVLQFPIANSKGGMTRYVLGNWKWMDKDKFHCDFVTMNRHLDFEEEVLKTGSKVFHISCYAEDDKNQFVKEFDEILNRGYDVVHLHTKQWKSFVMEEICKKHCVPKVIVHAHNSGIDTLDPVKRQKEEQLHEQVKKEFNENMATDFWACSEMAADFLFGEQIPQNIVQIMPNAIELDKFVYNDKIRNAYRKKYGLEKCFIIGHAGRFAYQKNHELMINVFRDIWEQVDNARLILLGEGDLMLETRRQVQNLGMMDKVIFLGNREDINHWYQAMDVFCLPSRFEGFPITLIEAMAAGLPCVASQAISKEVEISDNIIRLPFIKDEWVKHILSCYGSERKDTRMQLIKAGYDINNQVRRIEKIYRGGGNTL